MDNLTQQYEQQKTEFLDSLQPDDFRNGSGFNKTDTIIDEINKAVFRAVSNNQDPEEVIGKSVTKMFRETSPAIAKAVALARLYLEMRAANS